MTTANLIGVHVLALLILAIVVVFLLDRRKDKGWNEGHDAGEEHGKILGRRERETELAKLYSQLAAAKDQLTAARAKTAQARQESKDDHTLYVDYVQFTKTKCWALTFIDHDAEDGVRAQIVEELKRKVLREAEQYITIETCESWQRFGEEVRASLYVGARGGAGDNRAGDL